MSTKWRQARTPQADPVMRPGLISPEPAESGPGALRAPAVLRRRRPSMMLFPALVIATDVAALGLTWPLLQINPIVAVLMGVLGLALIASAGLYRQRLTLSALDSVPALLGRCVLAGAIAQSLGDVLHQGSAVLKVSLTAVLWAVAMTVTRAVLYAYQRRHRAAPGVIHPTLILGAGVVGSRIGGLLRDHPEYGLQPVGFIDDDPLVGPEALPAPLLGGPEQLAQAIADTKARTLVVAFSLLNESLMVDVIRSCDQADCEIYLIPRLFELSQPLPHTEHLWGVPLMRLPRPAFRSPLLVVKRAMDVAIAALALIVLAPVLGACALAARLETGEAIFRQERVGVGGLPFHVLKFQSLRPADPTESACRWSVSEDQRLGSVGRFLRRTSLDELPQLWNILRGHMSFVGPRPERPFFAGQFAGTFPRYSARTRVRVGLTGWAQVHHLRGDTSIEDRVIFDNHYIEHWSLWGDVKIILRTVPSVFRAMGG